MQPPSMQPDEKDRALISLLAENARLPVASLAKKLGLSRTTIQARMERLERAGIITGYGVRLSDSYQNAMIRAHILITIAPKSLAQVTLDLKKITHLSELHSVSGNFDLIAMITAPSIGELDALIDRIGHIDGVERTLSSIILSTRICRHTH